MTLQPRVGGFYATFSLTVKDCSCHFGASLAALPALDSGCVFG